MSRTFLVRSVAAATLVAAVAFFTWPRTETGTGPLEPVVLQAQPPAQPAPSTVRSQTVEFRKRDSFIALLLRHDVPPEAAHEIVAALRSAGAKLRQVRPGDTVSLSYANGRLVALKYAPSPWVRFEADERGSRWAAERLEADREVRIEARQGEVRRSLWDAVEGGAVAPQVLLDFVQIFESEFDFTADTRPGDRLRLLVEAHYADGVHVDYGRIVAAQYVSGGEVFTGIGFQEGARRYAYYDMQGRLLLRTCLCSPLRFSRISSGFRYRRGRPLCGVMCTNLAIDYAVPTGTTVWAVADGIVQLAGRNGGNGIQVLL